MSAKRPRQRNDRAAEYERQKLARRAALAAGKKRERKQENKKRVDNRSRPGRKRAAQQRGYRWLAKADDAAKAEAEQRKKGDEARAKAEAAQAEHAQQRLELARQVWRQRLQALTAKAEALIAWDWRVGLLPPDKRHLVWRVWSKDDPWRVCASCNWTTGCYRCDPFKCMRYHLVKEGFVGPGIYLGV